MAGPGTPSGEGPTYAPPQLPAGWIAQWDSASRKYYFVQLSTGASQWETPTEAIPTGATPAPPSEHPYGAPRGEIITHPDGSQTRRLPDGLMEPVMPDGSRGMGDSNGDRGLGSMASALLSGKNSGGSGSGGGLSSLAGQFLGGGNSGHGGSQGGGGGLSGGAGKLVGALASNLFSGSKSQTPPQNYHGGAPQGGSSPSGGLMAGVSSFLGGKQHGGSTSQDYGYSNSGTGGTYSGPEPPVSYQTPTAGSRPSHGSSHHGGSHSQQHYSSSGGHQSYGYGGGGGGGHYSSPGGYRSAPSSQAPSHGGHYPSAPQYQSQPPGSYPGQSQPPGGYPSYSQPPYSGGGQPSYAPQQYGSSHSFGANPHY